MTREQLEGISPATLHAVLAASGWSRLAGGHHYRSSLEARARVEVLVPQVGSPSYARWIHEALAGLANAEGITLESAFRRLTLAGHDTVRVRVAGTRIGGGEISLAAGAKLYGHASDLLLMAASATVRKEQHFQHRRPSEAHEFLEQVQLGAPEPGSFVAVFHSSVKDERSERSFVTQLDGERTFRRRSLLTLTQALAATHRAATRLDDDGESAFLSSVSDGVSANLCDAVVGLGQDTGADTLDIGVDWAPLFPEARPSKVTFTGELLDRVRRGAEILKQRPKNAVMAVRGFVVSLASRDPYEGGSAKLKVVAQGPVREGVLNLIDLTPDQYAIALAAHSSRTIVCVRGLVRFEAHSRSISDIKSIAVEPQPTQQEL